MRALNVAVVVAVLGGIFGEARAADDAKARIAAAKAMLTAQAKAFQKMDQAAWDKTFTADAQVSRGGAFAANGQVGLSLTFSEPSKVVIASSKFGWDGTEGWIAAEIKYTWTMYAEPEGAGNPHPKPETETVRWIAVYVPDGAGVKTRLLVVTKPKEAADHLEYNITQKMVPVPDVSAEVGLLAKPTELAARLSKDPATAVFGSTPAERGIGPAAAKKLLASWAKLTMEIAQAPGSKTTGVEEVTVGDLKAIMADVRYKSAKATKWTPLSGFALLRKSGNGWDVVAVVYEH